MLITTEGIIIRLMVKDISTLGRITSGVKLINLEDNVTVARVAKVREEKEVQNGQENDLEELDLEKPEKDNK